MQWPADGEADVAPRWSAALLRAHAVAAHAALLCALAWTAVQPQALAASPLHPEVLACTHLVTLGCIATMCVGAWHVVLPIALRATAPAGVADWGLLVALQLVACGVASHMAAGTWSGVAWSGGALLVLLVVQGWRWAPSLRAARGPLALRVGATIAFVNLAFAALLGGALAVDRTQPLLASGHLPAMWAHAHLALGGFAGTLVAAVGLRLLPMFLPTAPVTGALPWVAVLGLGVGGATCGAGALVGTGVIAAGQASLAVGAAAWLACAASMLRARKPMPPEVRAAAPSRVLIAAAMVSFAAALALGLLLLGGMQLDAAWRTGYGVLLIVGGFGSLILGIGQRLVPLAARLRSGIGPAHVMPSPALARVTSLLWCIGLVALVPGVVAGSPAWIRAGALAMGAAVLADLLNLLPRREPAYSLASVVRGNQTRNSA